MKTNRLIVLLAVLSQFAFATLYAAETPTPVKTVVPIVSSDLAKAPGAVELLITINLHGYVTAAVVKSSTNPALNNPCLAAVRQWRYTNPATGGATFLQPFHFGADFIDAAPVGTTRVEVISEVAPVLTEELSYITGEVTVVAAVDATGGVYTASIANSTHEELNAPSLAAAKQWTFKPAVFKGMPIASSVYIPFKFEGKSGGPAQPEVVDNYKLIPIRQTEPVIPDHLAHINAVASYGITVNPQGYVVSAVTNYSTNAELAEAGRIAILQWKFKPIVRNGIPVAVAASQPMQFGEGVVSAAPVDKLPSVKTSVSPTLPEELKDVSGYARVVFDVDATGHVTSLTIASSTHEAFTFAILAVAKDWTFNPAIRAGVPVPARISLPFVFGSAYE